MDYYEVLDLQPAGEQRAGGGGDVKRVSQEEVREAWRRLQKSVHPDLAGEYAAAAAALVNEAYEVLSSDAARSAFDADRDDWLRWGGRNGAGAADLSLMDSTPLSRWSGPVSDGHGGDSGSGSGSGSGRSVSYTHLTLPTILLV